MQFADLWTELVKGLAGFTLGHAVMIAIGVVLIVLAIVKQYEPVLLLPIGFGCILANIPLSGMMVSVVEQPLAEMGFFDVLYRAGITTELFPLLIFVGVGR